jgi:hypothetical protein
MERLRSRVRFRVLGGKVRLGGVNLDFCALLVENVRREKPEGPAQA